MSKADRLVSSYIYIYYSSIVCVLVCAGMLITTTTCAEPADDREVFARPGWGHCQDDSNFSGENNVSVPTAWKASDRDDVVAYMVLLLLFL